jgi:hypothetical protein
MEPQELQVLQDRRDYKALWDQVVDRALRDWLDLKGFKGL